MTEATFPSIALETELLLFFILALGRISRGSEVLHSWFFNWSQRLGSTGLLQLMTAGSVKRPT